jgi:antitoxin (DNA-binding transcriptional repressor) of toxin-antitoxin stability system
MAVYATMREFQQDAKSVLEKLRRPGDGIGIMTSHGKPVAVIMPVTPDNADTVAAEFRRLRLAAAFRAAQTSIAASGVTWKKDAAEKLVATARRGRTR